MSNLGVLVIDDDVVLRELLGEHLRDAGYTPLLAADGLQGLRLLFEHRPALVVLDVMMPGMDGWETCQRIRELSDVPIIMLTAKGETDDRLRGFDLGVDDYVVKPFDFRELIARIGAVLHRAQRAAGRPAHGPLVYSDLVIDLNQQRVLRNGRVIHLTPTEFRLLACLAERPGRVCSTEALLERVWGPEYRGQNEYVKRYIWMLRRKLEDDPQHPRRILTERGYGYLLVPAD